MKTFRKVPTA